MTGPLVAQPWIVVAVPFVLGIVIALSRGAGSKLAPWLAAIGPLLALTLGIVALNVVPYSGVVSEPWTSAVTASGRFVWFTLDGSSIGLGWSIDTLAALMLVVVGLVSTCVVVFSTGYMAGDPGWNRYFALISAFAGSMAMLVMADGFLTLFMGWELVGACSYLLIGFWFAKPSAARAAVKAFMTTRVGDVAMMMGMGVLWATVGSLVYPEVAERIGGIPQVWVNVAAILIAIGAIGKSAQFPLHAWLPDAMEGPTPVSALIHAATMVAAGVYVVVRAWPLFEASEPARMLLLTVGCISALGAALVAAVQRDIKKVLAYSTVSQLGFMFAALGAGAWAAAFFHLVTHAAFKGLLFLDSGSVIHGTGTQDIHQMGGLRRVMPVTFVTWVVGVLALVGMPGLAGFFSKDAVLEHVWAHSPVAGTALFAATLLTGYYGARTTRLVFFGKPHGDHPAHESPASMLLAMGALAVPALAVGWMGSSLSEVLGVEPEPLALGISAVAVTVTALGWLRGWHVGKEPRTDIAFFGRLGKTGRTLFAAYRWDAAVDRFVVGPVISACRTLWAFGDALIADGIVEGLGALGVRASDRLSSMHRGDAQRYATLAAVTIALMLAATVVLGR